MASVVVERKVLCRAQPSAVWRAVADNERLNRAVGLKRLKVRAENSDSAARFIVNTVSGGFPVEYEERPFEWKQDEHFSVLRVMRGGAVRSIETTFDLRAAADGGTEVCVRLNIEPRIVSLTPIIRFQAKRVVGRMVEQLKAFDNEPEAAQFKSWTSEVDEPAFSRATRTLVQQLSPDERPLAERLAEFVRSAPDADLARIRPLALSLHWQVDERKLLSVCLNAVVAGLLELSWDLICPSCRIASDQLTRLGDLPSTAHCQLCDLSYELELDRAVEATFRPTPAVRYVDQGPYCIGGPMNTPHVITQAILSPNAFIEVRAPREPGRYRVFARGGAIATLEINARGKHQGQLSLLEEGFEPHTLELAPASKLVVEQRGGSERHFKIEHLQWASRAATAHLISTLPQFRRQFAAEVLKRGLSLRVGRVALLFTDLTDSTALYARVGDAGAFHIVQEHFELLGSIIEQHHGVIVKTIGDAVMAAFVKEREAFSAAVQMQKAFPTFRATHSAAANAFLKIGIAAGPCYMVTANGILDYFGHIVNIAARLQGAARAGEVLLQSSLADEAQAHGWLDAECMVERFVAELKGVGEPIDATRLLVDRSARA